MAKKEYLYSLDVIKGILILLVIIGHILQGSANQNFARYLIYGFHMPLFIAVSGFLVNYERLRQIKAIELFKNYLYRVIIPWCLAVIGYYFIIHLKTGFHLKDLLYSFVSPFYHLWYIPAFLLYILITWLFSKIVHRFVFVLIFALLFSIIGYVLFLDPQIIKNYHLAKLDTLFKIIKPQFYFFFCIGVSAKIYANILKWNKWGLFAILAIFTGIYISCFFQFNVLLSTIGFFVLNTALAILILHIASNNKVRRVKILEWIGVNSLPVYLWHVVPLYILEQTIYNTQKALFYIFSVLGVIIVILIIKMLSKVNYINKYIFGSRS
jgi:acyltransferase